MSQIRSHCVLASLTEEQRDHLFDLLSSKSLAEVQEIVARPIEEGGFGLEVHKTTLTRFRVKEREERHARELAELAATAAIDEMPKRIELLIKAAKTEFAHATYDLAKCNNSSEDYERLDRALHHMEIITTRREELDQERARFLEQRRQWEFNVAREFMKNQVEYEKIHRTAGIDEESKIWLAREVAFGKDPSLGTAGILPAPESSLSPLPSVQPSESASSPVKRPQSSHRSHSSFNPPSCENAPSHLDTLKHVSQENPGSDASSGPAAVTT